MSSNGIWEEVLINLTSLNAWLPLPQKVPNKMAIGLQTLINHH